MPIANHYTIFFPILLIYYFYFRCILLQISHKKMFFYKHFYTRAFRGKLIADVPCYVSLKYHVIMFCNNRVFVDS